MFNRNTEFEDLYKGKALTTKEINKLLESEDATLVDDITIDLTEEVEEIATIIQINEDLWEIHSLYYCSTDCIKYIENPIRVKKVMYIYGGTIATVQYIPLED